jgi:hypothetical protein
MTQEPIYEDHGVLHLALDAEVHIFTLTSQTYDLEITTGVVSIAGVELLRRDYERDPHEVRSDRPNRPPTHQEVLADAVRQLLARHRAVEEPTP